MLTRTLPVFGAVVLAAAALLGQTPPPDQTPQKPADPQQPTFRSKATVVRVDVSVMGRGDQVVDDMAAADFTLEEDGVAQAIDTFQFIRLTGNTGDPSRPDDESIEIRSQEHAEAEAARPDVRVFAIFFDEYHIAGRRPAVTLPLREALVKFVESLGPIDLVTLVDPLTPLSALRFTRFHFDVTSKIRTLEGRLGEYTPVRSAVEEEQLTSRNPAALRAEVTLSALASLVTYLGSLSDARKSVLFVSHGPPLTFRRDGVDLRPRLQEIIEAANRGNVTISVMNPAGLTIGRTWPSDVLDALAYDTGGRRIVQTNDLAGGLRGVIQDASAYYLIGYKPTRDAADGKFRRIKVGTSRKDVRVVARKGYWAPKAEDLARAAAIANVPEVPGVRDALARLSTSKSGRAVDVWVGVARGEGGASRVQIEWETARTEAASQGPASLTAEPLDAAGAPAGAATDAIPPGTLVELMRAPGALTLRFTARDGRGDIVDSWKQAIEVPDWSASPVGLSTPRLMVARSALEVRALMAGGRAPTASRRFRRTDRVLVDVESQGPAELAVTAQLLNSAGAALVKLPPIAAGASEGLARFEIPLANLAAGTYLLRIDAKAGEAAAQQLVAFSVVP